jgi:hypothetical protein
MDTNYKEVVEYDADHYVDSTDARPAFEQQITEWILQTTPPLNGARR